MTGMAVGAAAAPVDWDDVAEATELVALLSWLPIEEVTELRAELKLF